ncbi:hybrid sensor histidine kinase/response regulator [Natrinema saccharevitans]|uniref:histidine kinase n=1 Tax=Natrinema saccharevitans TaxID=301967 RepID=A0A1S8ASV2_9EURY|nr:response regulator [Natrinema saccharevitans]OLZ39601.1 hybrid sensor histidine kinase/response regulator [Natrinema saccharevitans]
MSPGIRVLCVDADPQYRELTATVLERRNDEIDVTTAANGRDALAVFDGASDGPGRPIDCVVSDYELPDTDGLELFAAVRERDPAVPFVLFTGTEPDEIASEAISAGVTDYRRKWSGTAQYTVLANRIENAVVNRRAERVRRESERQLERYRTPVGNDRILELVPTALFTLDADAVIDWCNDEFADPFLEERTELIGTPFPALIDRGYYGESVTTKYVEEVRDLLSSATDRERAKYQVRFQSPDGEERIHDVHTRLLPLDSGEFTGTIHAIRDVTRRRRYRRELERQNERLAEFATLVSHDLRNPLNVAQGNLDFIEGEAEDHRVEKLQRSLARIEELIDGLLQLARQGKAIGDEERFPLAATVRAAWATVDTGDARLEIETDLELYGDETRVRSLLENLFRNTVEHGSTSPASHAQQDAVEQGCDDDRLTVTVGPLERKSQSTGSGDRFDGFYVEDTGAGLPADRESLFEFGHTTAAEGTGFGLAIVEGIAEAHGWTVAACDGDDGGARFEFRDVAVPTDGTKSARST